jgi:hypothetical protein
MERKSGKVAKVWDEKRKRWCIGGLQMGGPNMADGKLWTAVKNLKCCLTNVVRGWRYKDEDLSRLDDYTVVIYHLKEIERVPAPDWYKRNSK